MSVSIANYEELKNRVSRQTRQRGQEFDTLFPQWLNEVIWNIENGATPLPHTFDSDVTVTVPAGTYTVNISNLLSFHPFTVVREESDGNYSSPLAHIDASRIGPVSRRVEDRGTPTAYSFSETTGFRTTQITLYPAPDVDITLHVSGYFSSVQATWANTDTNYLIQNEPLLLIYGVTSAVYRHLNDDARAENAYNLYQRELFGNQPSHGVDGFMLRQHEKDVPEGGHRLMPRGERRAEYSPQTRSGSSSPSSSQTTNLPPVHVVTTNQLRTLQNPQVGWLAFNTDTKKFLIYRRDDSDVLGWQELTPDAADPDHTHDTEGAKQIRWFFDDQTFSRDEMLKPPTWHENILVYAYDDEDETGWDIPALREDDIAVSIMIFNASQNPDVGAEHLDIDFGFNSPDGEKKSARLEAGDYCSAIWNGDDWDVASFKPSEALAGFSVSGKTVTFTKLSGETYRAGPTDPAKTLTLPDDPPAKATQAQAIEARQGVIPDNNNYMTVLRTQQRINVMVKQWARIGQPDPSFGSATPDASSSVKGKWRYATSAEALGSATIPDGVGIEAKYIPRWVRNSATTVQVPRAKLPQASSTQFGVVKITNVDMFQRGVAGAVVTSDRLPSWVRIAAGKADSAAFIAGTTDRVITADVLPSWVRGTTTTKFNKYLADCTEPTANTLRFTRIDGTTFDIAVSGSSSGGSIPRAATTSQIGGVLRARNSDFNSAPTTALDGRYATLKQIWDLIGTRVTGATNPLVPSWARRTTNPLVTAAAIAFNTTGTSGQIVLTLTTAAGNIASAGTALPTGATNRYGVVLRAGTGDISRGSTGTAKYMTPALTVAQIQAQTATVGTATGNRGSVNLASASRFTNTGADTLEVVPLNAFPDWLRKNDNNNPLITGGSYASGTLTLTTGGSGADDIEITGLPTSTSGGNAYTLPAATTAVLGGVRLGTAAQFTNTGSNTNDGKVMTIGDFPTWLRSAAAPAGGVTLDQVTATANSRIQATVEPFALKGTVVKITDEHLPFATTQNAKTGTGADTVMSPELTKEAIAALATGGSGTASAEPVIVQFSDTVHTFDLEEKWDEWKNRRVVFTTTGSTISDLTIITGKVNHLTNTLTFPQGDVHKGGRLSVEQSRNQQIVGATSAATTAIVGSANRYFGSFRLQANAGRTALTSAIVDIVTSATSSVSSEVSGADLTDAFEKNGKIKFTVGNKTLVLPMSEATTSANDPYQWPVNVNLTEGDYTGTTALFDFYRAVTGSQAMQVTFELLDEDALGSWEPASDDAGDTIAFYPYKNQKVVFASQVAAYRCEGGGDSTALSMGKTKVSEIVPATQGAGDPFTVLYDRIWLLYPLLQNVNNFEIVSLPVRPTIDTAFLPNVLSLQDNWDNWKNKTVYLTNTDNNPLLDTKVELKLELNPYVFATTEWATNDGVLVYPGSWEGKTGFAINSYRDDTRTANGGPTSFANNRRAAITDSRFLPEGATKRWFFGLDVTTSVLNIQINSSGSYDGWNQGQLNSDWINRGKLLIRFSRSKIDGTDNSKHGDDIRIGPVAWYVVITPNNSFSFSRLPINDQTLKIYDVRSSNVVTYTGSAGILPIQKWLFDDDNPRGTGQLRFDNYFNLQFLLPNTEASQWKPPAEDAKKKITFVPLASNISVDGQFAHTTLSGDGQVVEYNDVNHVASLSHPGQSFTLTWLGSGNAGYRESNLIPPTPWIVQQAGGKEQEAEFVDVPFPDDYSLETKWDEWKDKIIYLLSPRDTQHLAALNFPLQEDQLIDMVFDPPIWSWVRSGDTYFGIDFAGEWGNRPGAPSVPGTDNYDYTELQVRQPKLLRNQGDKRFFRQILFWKTASAGRVQVDFIDKQPKTTDDSFTGNQDGTSGNRRLSDFFERQGIITVFIGPRPASNAAFAPKYRILVRTPELAATASSDYDWDPSVDNGVIYRWNSAGGDWDDVFTAGGGKTAWEVGWQAIRDEYTTTTNIDIYPKVRVSISVPAHESDKWKPSNADKFKKITFVPLYNGTSLRGDFSFVTIEKEANGHVPPQVDPADLRKHFINIQNPGIPFELTWTGTDNPFYLGLNRTARTFNWMVKPLASGVATPTVEYIDDDVTTFDLKQKWPAWKDRTVYLASSKDSTTAKEVRLGVEDYQTKQAHTRYLENMDRGLFHAETGGFSIRSFAEGGNTHRGAIVDSEFTAFGNNTPLYLYRVNVYENSVAIQVTRNATYTGGALTLDRFSTKFQNSGYLEITLRHTAYGYIYKFRIYMRRPTGSRNRLAFEGDATDAAAGYTSTTQLNSFVEVYDGANNKLTRTTMLNTVKSWGDYTASATIKFYLPESSSDSWIPIESDATKSVKFFPLYNNMVAKAAFPSIINGQARESLEVIPNSSEPFDLTFTGTVNPYRLGTTKRSWVISSKSDPEGPVGQLLAQTSSISLASYSNTFTQNSGAQGFGSGGIYSIQGGALYYYCRRRIPNQVGFWITMENSSGVVVAESGTPLIGYPQGEGGGRGSNSPFGFLYLYDVPAPNEHVRFKLYVTEQGSTAGVFCSNIGLSGGADDGASASSNARTLTYTVKIYEWIQPS